MRIMKLAEILDESLEIVKKNAGTILMFNLLFGLIYIAAFIILGVFAAISAGFSIAASSDIGVIVVIGILAFLLMSMVMAQMAGNIKIGEKGLNQEKIEFGGAFKIAFRKIPTIACVLVVYLVCIAPIGVISFKIVDEFYLLFLSYMDEWINVVAIVIIMLVVSFVFIMVTNFFVFTIHAVVVENLGPVKSIARSFGLVRTQFWRIFGSMLLIQLVIAAVQYSLISFVAYFGGIIFLIGQLLSLAPEGLYQIAFFLVPYLQWPVNILSYLFLMPMTIIMTTLLYFNIRFKTEGYDLILNINELERNIESAE